MNVARDEQIAKLARQGLSRTAIAQRVGMTPMGIKYALNRLAGIPRHRPHPDDELAAVTADDEDEQFWKF